MWKQRTGMALWLLAAALLCFFENNTGTKAVLAASVVIPLFSVCCAAWTANRLSISVKAPEQCREGQHVHAACSMTGSWPRLMCTMQYELAVCNRMTGQEKLLTCRDASDIVLDTAVCGAISIRAVSLEVSDWFGLCAFTRETAASAETLVLPALYPVTIRLGASEAPAEVRMLPQGSGHSADETIGVRPYRPGDAIRMIHWKLSGKLDETMLRETGQPDEEQVILLLENRIADQTTPEEMHASVKALLSTVHALLEIGIPCRVCTRANDKGELLLWSVTCEDDAAGLCRQLLVTAFSQSGESICTLFAAQCAELHAAHTALFSPCARTDAASLYDGRRVTLVLSPGDDTPAAAETSVCRLSETEPFLEL